MSPGPIYLDYNATTPVDPRVLEAMMPYFRESFANAASSHQLGREAARAVERAREQVAEALGADPREVVWTSGATEANNLAIQGVAASPAYRGRRQIVTVATEHRAVLDPCSALQRHGFEVSVLPVDSSGRIELERLAAKLTDQTLLVSIMVANNETGVLHPIEEIGRICRDRRVLLHTDATQAVGRESIDVNGAGIDLLSLSGHKFYGPKGTGALFVRRKGPRTRCEPLLHGGGHERGLRSGTLNVPGIVGLGAAIELAGRERESDRSRLKRLRDHLEARLLDLFPTARVNGALDSRLVNTCNISLPGTDADGLIDRLTGLAVSSSAACTSAKLQPSYVLRAMGRSAAEIRGSLRFSVGRFTTEEEIDGALREISAATDGRRQS
jgi:cysteine desulfurase